MVKKLFIFSLITTLIFGAFCMEKSSQFNSTDDSQKLLEKDLTLDLNEGFQETNAALSSEQSTIIEKEIVAEILENFEQLANASKEISEEIIENQDQEFFVLIPEKNQLAEEALGDSDETQSDTENLIRFATEEEIENIKKVSDSKSNTKHQAQTQTPTREKKHKRSNKKGNSSRKKPQTSTNNDKRFKCPKCEKSYSKKYNFTRHYRSTHGSGYWCLLCDIKLGTYRQLCNHNKKVHTK